MGAQYALKQGFDSDDTSNLQTAITNATNLSDVTVDALSEACECEDGTSITCGDTCTDGSSNRKWITITLSKTIDPLFWDSLLSSVSSTVVVQVQ